MEFKDLLIKSSYVGKGSIILNEFLLPLLSNACSYDRITGYYSIESLLAISQGLESMYQNGGKMRLIIGSHSIPEEIIAATLNRSELIDDILEARDNLRMQIMSLTDSLERKRIATIAWMIEDGLLIVKSASVDGRGIFHPKTLLLTDLRGDEVVAVGSSNETRNGLGSNFEQLMVAKSWDNQEAVNIQREFFSGLWHNEMNGVTVHDITEDTHNLIEEALGKEYITQVRESSSVENIIFEMSKMPSNFFVSGDIPSLYIHQERAVIDALSRWPVRVLFSDEVGLGKTFEAAATLAFLVKYCGVKRVIILTPKSVLQQWQDELSSKFNINFWLYDSGNKQYVSPDEKAIYIGNENPIGDKSPNLILMSSQFARGTKKNNNIFERDDSVLPDLLIVDEAHSARVSTDLAGNKTKTQIYSMLETVSRNIPHLVLATATPMQKDANEYHSILKLLGVPKGWQKQRLYQLSLRIISSNTCPDLSDASTAARLVIETLKYMKPCFDKLDAEEISLLNMINSCNPKETHELATIVVANWGVFKTIFIKLHPARLLTVRNTRKSLTEVGYKFPERKLIEVNLKNSDQIELFYGQLYKYLSTECFLIEKALSPSKKINLGFIRVSLQQRVASSLYSCLETLKRRFVKVQKLHYDLEKFGIDFLGSNGDFDVNNVLDDIENDELLSLDDYILEENSKSQVDSTDLKRAVQLEYAALSSLINQVKVLINIFGDKKLNQSIALCMENVNRGDSVLLFSRYTDTVEALVKEYLKQNCNMVPNYAIYTGSKSLVVINGREEKCDKDTIKRELFNGKLRVVFCSDAASEGLNLQAARVLINVDVPWTPSRLEQRIGRIARLGQTASEVNIYNVWYPHSVEARMYHRIQTRLRDTNIAVGEFPDVLAEGIKQALIMNSIEDVNISQLLEIRNSSQTKALKELWTVENSQNTGSDVIRNQLINLCNEFFESQGEILSGTIKRYKLPNGEYVDLSPNCGLSESISLKSEVWKHVDYKVENARIGYINGIASSVVDCNSGKPVKFEVILEMVYKNKVDNQNILDWPKTLPNTKMLDLSYSVDVELNPPVKLWEDIGG